MAPDAHRICVVVPTIGRPELSRCLAALDRQTRRPDEVVVVRDEAGRGASWARNEGIRRSQGDLVAFTDDDCVPPPDWIEQLIRAMDWYEAAGAGGTFQESDPFLQAIRLRQDRQRAWREVPTAQVDTLGLVGSGGSIMYRRSWLEACRRQDGYIFNEMFRMSQDWELSWRLRARGALMALIPSRVTHLSQLTAWDFLRQRFGRGRAIAQLFMLQRRLGASITIHRSLLWGGPDGRRKPQWLRAFWLKAVGPFDLDSFPHRRQFWLFWLGEKVQGLGFCWGMLHDRVQRPRVAHA